ncbi:phosphoribosylformylglycinamidine synthase [Helicoverpa zea]|uniref:phosphoribosylformylglycinamidine synthase n=1 Tax=Helicoverpa zea TaxID=7113 RepID=UPI001F55D6B7|nr:phosphoribosylformylglycinamidine synthase [Helicoverpa zea]XP_047020026.1 phosphoribosylformylglycinamidine synthase [Helicoverpa zea]XP_047020027.1 phosphoribosylformylglycinamidine synthase [Helicoverpa zea]XP_047020028.1 phosphoribosylformylglycinamidine synthase [Helicoverpa zea]
MCIIRFFCSEAFSAHKTKEILEKLQQVDADIVELSTELCYHVELREGCDYLNINQIKVLKWLLSSPLQPQALRNETVYKDVKGSQTIIEIGPRFNFSTADSSNSVQICESVGLHDVIRLEVSTRYLITFGRPKNVSEKLHEALAAPLHDRMTQCVYTKENLPRVSFNEGLPKDLEPWFVVPLLKEGRPAMEKVNKKLGLAFDSWDMDFYMDMFVNKLKRDPTSVELFDLAQSNSEHSRHWFFKGKLVLDGKEINESLIDMVASTQKTSNDNNVIKFGDNSSAIKGFKHSKLRPTNVRDPSQVVKEETESDIIFTAETHNMPTAVAPFSGATTGTGGRIRDVQGVGRGGHTVAGTAGYSVGNLHIPGYELPWEEKGWEYPNNFASPLQIIIDASNGASDYGNKFGEPLISGFVQSYGLKNGDNVREEFVKPIMFSGGIGYMPHNMIKKNKPEKGMMLVKVGGPVYRIGVGGGAASSVAVQGGDARDHALDFGAVQRGDAEMGNRLNRVVRGCLEADINPVESIHDQGAGGNGNVLKELVEPEGAVVYTKEFQLGDPTITTLELWGAEYQENDALLCSKENRPVLEDICRRERCPVSFVGEVTGDGYMSLVEDAYTNKYLNRNERLKPETQSKMPYDLHLEAVLGNMPRKTFDLVTEKRTKLPLSLPQNVTVHDALNRVLRLVNVASKRYLTNKVDRCVTGLIAQQQCVGPLHTPLADCAIIALSYYDLVGSATSIGTQNIKGLLDPAAGARMSLGEALTNLVFAGISELEDVKCSGNWMWAGKTGAEGGALVLACRAVCDAMARVGVAVDGGKDSLSMCAQVAGEKVKSPGTLVVSTYAPCPDITVKIEPALLQEGSALVYVPVSPGKYRLGGSALAQCYKQLGDNPPDLDDPAVLKAMFKVTQKLLKEGKLLSGHDVSEGGFVTTALEMGIGGIRGMNLDIQVEQNVSDIQALFNEELGIIVEVTRDNVLYVLNEYKKNGVNAKQIGTSGHYGMNSEVTIKVNGKKVLDTKLIDMYRMWEETSYQLECLQANSDCVRQEWQGLGKRKGVTYNVTFDPSAAVVKTKPIRVAVLREEGTNGDREMIASLMMANFDVFDVTMSDLQNKKITLDAFQGLVFPGGFSYADTLGSAKGWAAGILFSDSLSSQFSHFKNRNDTFSLGVCNGCQLMALLGWVDPETTAKSANKTQVFLDHNASERFECRWSAVKITENNSDVWFRGMGGSVLGVWVAHGEGRFTVAEPRLLDKLQDNGQVAMQYVDDSGEPTEEYPMNPNGSPVGIAGVRSRDGRHIAMMPHPERCVLRWQCSVTAAAPAGAANPTSQASPWSRLFQNAYSWASHQ